jgi:hypothetical protein
MTDAPFKALVRKLVVLIGLVAGLIVVQPTPAQATCVFYPDCESSCDWEEWYCDMTCHSLYSGDDYFVCSAGCWSRYSDCEQYCAYNACI